MPPKKRTSDLDGEGSAKKPRKSAKESANGADVDDGTVYPTIKLEGSLISGTLLMCGGTNWDLIGRSSVPKGTKNLGGRSLWGPHKVEALEDVKVRTVVSSPLACHSIVIDTEGRVYTFGRNEKGQLGHGDTERRDKPTMIECMKDVNIVDAACGKNHSLLLTEYGQVYAFGENKMAQLGLGHQSNYEPTPSKVAHKGPAVRRLACGAEFSVIIDVVGSVYSFGCPEYGQLGHNTDGKYFVSSNKLAFQCVTKPRRVPLFIEKQRNNQVLPVDDVEIVDAACGTNHTIVVDRKKRIYTWGFGGYGRLGHNEPKDEMIPRLIKGWDDPNRGAVLIAAGSAYTMAVNEIGCLYLWGQNKPTGEAAMYPKPVQDLSGWQVRSIGCANRSIVIAADQSVVSWGPSPTFGELGYGENKPKSSSYAQEVRPLDGIYVHKVTCGYGHTLMIARCDSEEDKAKIDKLPDY